MIKGFFYLFILIALLVLLYDEDLDPVTARWISILENRDKTESQAFFYLKGIMATENNSIIAKGKERTDNYMKAEKDSSKRSEIEYKYYSESSSWINIPDKYDKLYCSMYENCLKDIINTAERWNSELEDRASLLQRYNEFLRFDEFTTPSMKSPILGEYRYLNFGNHLSLFKALSLSREGLYEKAIDYLLGDIKLLRIQLRLADNLMHKLTFTHMLSNNIEIISYIYQSNGIRKIYNVSQLSMDELNIEKPLFEYFNSMFYLGYLDMKNNFGNNILIKVFNPNMQLNGAVSVFSKIILLSTLSPEKFAENKTAKIQPPKKIFDVFNLASTELEWINNSNSLVLVLARIYDLNGKISLVNYVLSNKNTPLKNPYYPKRVVAFNNNGMTCLEGPYEDRYNLRCINIIAQ